jgi:hypothetical protein
LYTSWLYRPLPDYNIIYKNDDDDDDDDNDKEYDKNKVVNNNNNNNEDFNKSNISLINDNNNFNNQSNNYHNDYNKVINIDNQHTNYQKKIIQQNQSQNYKLTDSADRELPILYYISSQVVIFITSIIVRIFLIYGGEYKLIIDDNYYHFLKLVYDRHDNKNNYNDFKRKSGTSEICSSKHSNNDFKSDNSSSCSKSRPLLTISNHRSLMDDPMILSSILPFWVAIQPKYNRYSICAQEYCFNSNVMMMMMMMIVMLIIVILFMRTNMIMIIAIVILFYSMMIDDISDFDDNNDSYSI